MAAKEARDIEELKERSGLQDMRQERRQQTGPAPGQVDSMEVIEELKQIIGNMAQEMAILKLQLKKSEGSK